MSQDDIPSPLLVYDGECRFCHSTVEFVLAREKKEELHFAWGQSPEVKYWLKEIGAASDLKSVQLLEDGELYSDSTAALRICKYLKSPWSWLVISLYLPIWLRDGVYQWIAQRRRKIMGSMQCTLPIDEAHRYWPKIGQH